MRRPQGYALTQFADGRIEEEDTFTCGHCSRVVFVQAKCDPADLGGFCRGCMRHICGPCTDQPGCTPIEKRLEQMEARDRMLRAVLG